MVSITSKRFSVGMGDGGGVEVFCPPGFSLDTAYSSYIWRNGYFTSISSTLIHSNCRTGSILSGSLMFQLSYSCGSNNTLSLATNLAAFEKKNCMNRLMDLKLFYHWGACEMFTCLLPFNITATCTVASIARSLQCKLLYHDSSLVIGAPLNCSNCLFFIRVFFCSYIVAGSCTLYLNITFNFLLFHCETPAHRILSLLKCKYTAYTVFIGTTKRNMFFQQNSPLKTSKWNEMPLP